MPSSLPGTPIPAPEPPPRGLAALYARLPAPLLELVRFGGVGTTCAAIYFVLLWASGEFFKLPMAVRATLAYAPSMLANYLLHRTFTFRSTRPHAHAGPRYVIVQLGGMLINSGVLWLGVDVKAGPYLPVQAAAICIMALWSFAGQKLWTFS